MTGSACQCYHSVMLTTKERTRRILSDVHVAVINNVNDIEQSLDRPDQLKLFMERIVSHNPRIRSCGISFKANYYPQKGAWFCPYAIRRDSATVETLFLGDTTHDYLSAEWFHEVMASNEEKWSQPFFDGYDSKTPLISYMVPIHDKQGSVVAVLGADVSLNELTKRLHEIDAMNNAESMLGLGSLAESLSSYSFIIADDGTYIAHPDEKRILKENYFTYAEASKDTLATHIGRQMLAGKTSNLEYATKVNIEGVESYVFYTPLKHTDWSMAIIVPTITIQAQGIALGIITLVFLFLVLLVIFFVCRITIRHATKPLKQLATSAGEVAKGRFNTPLPHIRHQDEIHQLRDSFENMQQSLSQYVDKLKATTAQRAAIESELSIAHSIQMAMLPKKFPPYPDRTDIDIYGQLTPAKAVGGDLFDFYIHDEQLFFCIGDVSGKGVPASLVMAVTRSLFRNVSAHVSAPEKILKALNEVLSENNETNMFVTFFVGVLDLKSGLLRYSNAGHEAPMLVGRGIGMLPCDANLPLGIQYDWNFTQQEISIDTNTTIFLFTDGLTEAEDSSHAQFGEGRIQRVAERQLAEKNHSPRKFIDRMTQAVHSFVGQAEQSDDLTMLAIQVQPSNLFQ